MNDRSAGIPGPRSQALADRLRGAESTNITLLTDNFPVFWERARGCTVVDVDGNEYLDSTGAFGVAALGHSHPKVARAIHAQAERLLHGMGDVHPPAAKVSLCEALRDCAPFAHGRVILAGGGAEAVEAALKTAALTTGRPGVIAFEGAYHGLTYGALAVTHRPDFRMHWLNQLGHHSTFVPFPEDAAQARAVLELLVERFREGTPAGSIGAVIMEPIQGRGGVRVPPDGFLSQLANLTREHGGLLIADEIFTGLGRTGRYWACDHEGVTPDIVVCGKALAGGLPVGACIGSPDAMAGWPASTGEALHTSTFLGNPLVCAAACAALDLLRAPELLVAVNERGEQLREGLAALAARHRAVHTVRGRGLMLGMVLDSADRCGRIVVEALQHGLLLLGGGMHRNVLTITPPFVISPDEVEELLRRLDATLAACGN